MSSSSGAALGYPQTNSSAGAEGGEPPDSETGELPTVEERVAEFVADYPTLAKLPLSRTDGQKLREEVVEEVVEEEWWYDHEIDRARKREELRERRAKTWAEGVRELLEWNEECRDRSLRMTKGYPWEAEYESFETDAEHSFHPEYAEREYAQLQALARETAGGEYPDVDVEREGQFEDPYIAFFSLTASTIPDGDHVPPVDHDRQVVDTWSGNAGVYRELWNVMRDLGVPPEAWVYHRQGEPHGGGGAATCYRHDHPLVIFDTAAIDGEPTAEDFHSVVDTHVEWCEWAGREAHEYDDAITVEPVGESGVADVAAYMAEYVSFGSEDLAEREIEYVAYAAIQWATNSQKYTRSDGANAAIRADRCRQRAADPEHDQVRGHGEEVRRATSEGEGTPRHDYECSSCGSPWGIDQDPETLTEHRVRESSSGSTDGPQRGLRGRWQSAQAAAVVGEEGEAAVFERPAQWQLEAVVDGDGEEHPPSPGGPTMLPLVLENRTLDEWAEDRPPPEPGKMSQRQRVGAILGAAEGGASIEEVVEAVDAEAATAEQDIEQLLRRGELYRPQNGVVRPV